MADKRLKDAGPAIPAAPTDARASSTEAALWASFTDADRARLILAYKPLVFSIISRLSFPPALAVDVAAEGMVALIEAVDSFDASHGAKFTTHAYMRIRGRMLDFLRRAGAANLAEPAPPDAVEALIPTDLGAYARYLRRLPPIEQKVLLLTFTEGMSRTEVARALNYSPSYAARLYKKAVKRLQGIFWYYSRKPQGIPTT
jgi:RNA polymerase sporulation-specific sigma factor